MKEMTLDDLLNTLWAALEISRGTPLFFETIEKELAKRIRTIKDDQFEALMNCFGIEHKEKNSTVQD
jgi:hypothetical protein